MFHQIFSICIFLQISNSVGYIVGVISKDVILNCQFGPANLDDIIIHWTQGPRVVHSFYRSTDQLAKQAEAYRGRTKLFTSEISSGNGSLLLSSIDITDEGEYNCYASTPDGKYENKVPLKVGAEYRNLLLTPPNMLSVETMPASLSCSASGGYPNFTLLWQTVRNDGMDEKNTITPMDEKTTISHDTKGLFIVRSNLNIMQTSNRTYKCNIKNDLLNQSWNGSWKMQGTQDGKVGQDITLHHIYSNNDSSDLAITWRFKNTENSSSVILCELKGQKSTEDAKCGDKPSTTENEWNVSLVLHNVTLQDSGEYTCEITSKSSTQLFTNILKLETLPIIAPETSENLRHHYTIIASILLVLSLTTFVIFYKPK
uniref:HERV-H LTR-associating protein 2 n=1 Tax=Callorhinchus milii TaxID=7868 RepID=V9KJ09_CALMI